MVMHGSESSIRSRPDEDGVILYAVNRSTEPSELTTGYSYASRSGD